MFISNKLFENIFICIVLRINIVFLVWFLFANCCLLSLLNVASVVILIVFLPAGFTAIVPRWQSGFEIWWLIGSAMRESEGRLHWCGGVALVVALVWCVVWLQIVSLRARPIRLCHCAETRYPTRAQTNSIQRQTTNRATTRDTCKHSYLLFLQQFFCYF